MNELAISHSSHIVALLPALATHTPHNELLAVATRRSEKLHSQLNDGEETRLGPMLTIPLSSKDLLNSPIEAVFTQIREFVRQYLVNELVIVWYCDNAELSVAQYVEFSALADALERLQRSCAEKPGGFVEHVLFYLTDYERCICVNDLADIAASQGRSCTLHAYARCIYCAFLNSVDRRFEQSYEDIRARVEEKISTSGVSVPPAEIGTNVYDSDVWERGKKLLPQQKEVIAQAYACAAECAQPHSVALWNRIIRTIAEQGFAPDALDGADIRLDPVKIGTLAAQISFQHVRDRVILYAVHPTVTSIGSISSRQLVGLMADASSALPDVCKAHAVIGVLALLSSYVPQNKPMLYAAIAYIQWWLGEGSRARQSVDAVHEHIGSISMLSLVDYALRVQLPPPWITTGTKETA